MTDEQIIEKLATEVMGADEFGRFITVEGSVEYLVYWNPLESISDAWDVVEKIEEEEIDISLWREVVTPFSKDIWSVVLKEYDTKEFYTSADQSIKRAICMAALKWLESKEKDNE